MSGLLIAVLDKLVDAYGVDRFRANRRLMIALGIGLIAVAIGYAFIDRLFPRALEIITTAAVGGVGLTLLGVVLRSGDVRAGKPDGVLVIALVSLRPVTPESSEGAALLTHQLSRDLDAVSRAGAPIRVRLRPEPLPLSHTEEERVEEARRIAGLPRLDAHVCVFGDVVRDATGEWALDFRAICCVEFPGAALADMRDREVMPSDPQKAPSLCEKFLSRLCYEALLVDPASPWALQILQHVRNPSAHFNRALILLRSADKEMGSQQHERLIMALAECDHATRHRIPGLTSFQATPDAEEETFDVELAYLRSEILIRLAEHEQGDIVAAHLAEAVDILRSQVVRYPARRPTLVKALALAAALRPDDLALAREAIELAAELLRNHRALLEDQLAMIVRDFAILTGTLVRANSPTNAADIEEFVAIIGLLKAEWSENPFVKYHVCFAEALCLNNLANRGGTDRVWMVAQGLEAVETAMAIASAREMSRNDRGALQMVRGLLRFHEASMINRDGINRVAAFERSIEDLQVGLSLRQLPEVSDNWWMASVTILGSRARIGMSTAPSENSLALLETTAVGLRGLRYHPCAIPGTANHGFLMMLTAETLLTLARYRGGDERHRLAAEALMAVSEAQKGMWSDAIAGQLAALHSEAAQMLAGATTYVIEQPLSGIQAS